MSECRRRDSNPHSLRHTPLKRACLPISPLRLKYSKLKVTNFRFIQSVILNLQFSIYLCPGLDSNQHTLRHYPLKVACLPMSPPGLFNRQIVPDVRDLKSKDVLYDFQSHNSLSSLAHRSSKIHGKLGYIIGLFDWAKGCFVFANVILQRS